MSILSLWIAVSETQSCPFCLQRQSNPKSLKTRGYEYVPRSIHCVPLRFWQLKTHFERHLPLHQSPRLLHQLRLHLPSCWGWNLYGQVRQELWWHNPLTRRVWHRCQLLLLSPFLFFNSLFGRPIGRILCYIVWHLFLLIFFLCCWLISSD